MNGGAGVGDERVNGVPLAAAMGSGGTAGSAGCAA